MTRERLGRSDEEMLWVWCGGDCLKGIAGRRWACRFVGILWRGRCGYDCGWLVQVRVGLFVDN